MLAVIEHAKTESGYGSDIDLDELLHLSRSNGASFNGFEGVVGSSRAFRRVLDQIRAVAPTDSTALIEGETGTGKEVVAIAIHALSNRRNRPFATLNCAAIPLGLLESELFGHEKGAFTGAVAQKLGRFEAANAGTLFLDEIGDIPLELQPKLLRVLQDQKFERLGSSRTIRVDVRIVAATNQDLAQLVRERRFRSDLFYRLNVFPIALPPLRERQEDIPLLVGHFVRKFARRLDKDISRIPEAVMGVLWEHDWPGNIRELQNLLERAVIMSSGPELHLPCGDFRTLINSAAPSAIRTLAEAERDYILETLRRTDWVVGGSTGAAARLGVPRTTLIYKMRKLGIDRKRVAFGNV